MEGRRPGSEEAEARPAPPLLPGNGLRARLNWLRAGVLGANDGIISTAGLVVGVAAATSDRTTILVSGVAAVVAGAVSMALGEFVSVSSARDTERALVRAVGRAVRRDPAGERAALAAVYRTKGLSAATAEQVAAELSARDPVDAHLDAQLGLDPDDLTNPWHAGAASAAAFLLGALLPLLAIVLAAPANRIAVTYVAVMVALVVTGSLSAWFGRAGRLRAVARLLVGGTLAMAVTYAVGTALGVAV